MLTPQSGQAYRSLKRTSPPPANADADKALGKPGGDFQGVAQALPDPLLDDEAVDDHVDVVAPVLVEGDLLGEFPDLAVHADADVPLLQKLFQLLLELPLLPPGNRGEDRHAGVRRIREDRLQHHVDRLGLDLLPALGAVGNADPGEEEPEMVVDLRHRPHGGTGVVGGRPLLDRDRRGEPLDRFHVRFVHLADELPGVGGERLHIAPLPLGVDGVEGKRRFPGTADAGDDDKAVPRDIQVDVLEVVLCGALDFNGIHYNLISMCDFFRSSSIHSPYFFSIFSRSIFSRISSRTLSIALSPAPRRSTTWMM